MSSANLSFSLVEKYLEVALSNGFVRVERSKYLLTERGHEFLSQYRRFDEQYVKAQKLLEDVERERERLIDLVKAFQLLESTGPAVDPGAQRKLEAKFRLDSFRDARLFSSR
jgi:hypothetical protein